MSRYRRARSGRTFFFTVVTHGRRSILCEDRSRAVLREALRELRQARPFTLCHRSLGALARSHPLHLDPAGK